MFYYYAIIVNDEFTLKFIKLLEDEFKISNHADWIASHRCVIMTNLMAFEFHSKPSACPVPAVENLLIFHRPTSVEVQTFENEVYLVGLRSWYD